MVFVSVFPRLFYLPLLRSEKMMKSQMKDGKRNQKINNIFRLKWIKKEENMTKLVIKGPMNFDFSLFWSAKHMSNNIGRVVILRTHSHSNIFAWKDGRYDPRSTVHLGNCAICPNLDYEAKKTPSYTFMNSEYKKIVVEVLRNAHTLYVFLYYHIMISTTTNDLEVTNQRTQT